MRLKNNKDKIFLSLVTLSFILGWGLSGEITPVDDYEPTGMEIPQHFERSEKMLGFQDSYNPMQKTMNFSACYLEKSERNSRYPESGIVPAVFKQEVSNVRQETSFHMIEAANKMDNHYKN